MWALSWPPIMLFLLPSKNPHLGVSIFQLLRRIDWIGVILVTSSLALFTLAISFDGNQFAWSSDVVIGFFMASDVPATLFSLSQTILLGNTKEKCLFPVQYFLRKDMVLLSVTSGAGACMYHVCRGLLCPALLPIHSWRYRNQGCSNTPYHCFVCDRHSW